MRGGDKKTQKGGEKEEGLMGALVKQPQIQCTEDKGIGIF